MSAFDNLDMRLNDLLLQVVALSLSINHTDTLSEMFPIYNEYGQCSLENPQIIIIFATST